jgi:hypothetical protein
MFRSKRSKNMIGNSKNLIPSEDDIRKLIAEVPNIPPASIPVTIIQIMVARMMLKFIDKMRGNLAESINELEKSIDKFM